MDNEKPPFDIFPPTHAVTVPTAAYAADVAPRTFRGWLESGRVRLLVPRKAAGAWLRCAPADIVRLAVLARLLQFGLTLAEANSVICEHIDRHIEGVVLATGDCPWQRLLTAFRALSLTVSRECNGVAVSVRTIFGRGMPAAHTGAELTVNVGWIAAEVHRRVREMADA